MNASRLSALTLAFLLTLGAPCAAQEVSREGAAHAEALKRSGNAAMDALRYAEALDAYRSAYAITKQPALLYNQARALEALDDYPASLAMLERFVAEAPPSVKARAAGLDGLLADVRSRVTDLRLTCTEGGAEVRVGDHVLGLTPLVGVTRVNAGHAVLTVHKDGFVPFERTVDLPGGGTFGLDVELTPVDTTATLSIQADVSGAQIFVDRGVPATAPTEARLPPGSHTVVATRSGYVTTRSVVVLGEAEHKEILVHLEAVPPITHKWWFWTGVGVVVTGVAVTVYALTKERSPDDGTLSPGRVAAPLTF